MQIIDLIRGGTAEVAIASVPFRVSGSGYFKWEAKDKYDNTIGVGFCTKGGDVITDTSVKKLKLISMEGVSFSVYIGV